MASRRASLFSRTVLLGGLALGLSGCGYTLQGLVDGEQPAVDPMASVRTNTSALAGTQTAGAPSAQAGVNVYLWRASLDTLSFMPMIQADPLAGVVLTDWHSPAQNGTERFKINLLIIDTALRADGVKATVFRQVRDPQGNWRDAPVSPDTPTQIEDAILTKARQLRVAAQG